jgi:hypothetical protein
MRLTDHEVLRTADQHEEAYRSRYRRDQIATAFGGKVLSDSWCLPVDAVGLKLAENLSKAYGAGTAAMLVRVFGQVWLAAVAQGDADRLKHAMFSIVDLIRESDGRLAYLACHHATPEIIDAGAAKAALAEGYTIERVNTVNISRIVRLVRANAAWIGLDLSAPFMPAPTTPEFEALMAPYTEPGNGLVEVRAIKKREALARRIGEQVRARAMGGIGHRKWRVRNLEVSATTA